MARRLLGPYDTLLCVLIVITIIAITIVTTFLVTLLLPSLHIHERRRQIRERPKRELPVETDDEDESRKKSRLEERTDDNHPQLNNPNPKETLKKAVTRTPVLLYYNLKEDITLQCDTSQ